MKKTSNRETTLHGLQSFTNYSVKTLAYTLGGEGVVSEPVFCLTETDGNFFFYTLSFSFLVNSLTANRKQIAEQEVHKGRGTKSISKPVSSIQYACILYIVYQFIILLCLVSYQKYGRWKMINECTQYYKLYIYYIKVFGIRN